METDKTKTRDDAAAAPSPTDGVGGAAADGSDSSEMPREINGPKGPEPTRYGDWEQKGRCSDF
ncbi:MAG: succinate dehydrogenase assembly factor 4 [Candidatus Puniceispirillaceae bacterium]